MKEFIYFCIADAQSNSIIFLTLLPILFAFPGEIFSSYGEIIFQECFGFHIH